MHRSATLQRLTAETFDLCIIGGGASGAGSALDAALRGLRVALVEKSDFAAGTSSKSTKLIHGGVRYLEQAFKNLDAGQLRQVRHGLEERHILLANAPHLARPLALLTPVFSWWEGLYFRIGLWLYDRFAAGSDPLPGSRWLSKTEAQRRLPGLSERLHSAVLYYDGQMDDARYCLALVQSAAEAGAVVLNHAAVTGFEKNIHGQLSAALVRDQLAAPPAEPIRLRARVFLNCSGPGADAVRRLANPALPGRIRPSKGVHLLLPQSVLGAAETALLIPKTPDGRVVFAIPFQGKILLGTTDQDYPTPDQEPRLEAAEVDFLLDTLAPYLRQRPDKQSVCAGFGGLRPLLAASTQQTKGLVRDHELERDPHSGLLSLLGGKWTTYRLMARDAVDAVCHLLQTPRPCRTENHRLAGAAGYTPDDWKTLAAQHGLPPETARHLSHNYGSRAGQVVALVQENAAWAQPLVDGFPFIRAEVVYAARAEMACTLRDVLARRIRLEILDWQATLAAIPVAAALLAPEWGWSAAETERQAEVYREEVGGKAKCKM
ncbi:MAG: FAD-dependent oxidoreductase [Saprospiraceae bacterium]|nr:FAD-dependent oxidoreductase [Saprospiraceae bacterium]